MHRQRSLLLCAAAATILAAASLLPLGPFEVFELKTLDLRFRMRERWRAEPPVERVRTVLLDDRSLASFAHWPLPYTAYAHAVLNLRAAEPRALGLDVLLAPADTSRPLEERGYRLLMSELAKSPHTVLAVAPPLEGLPGGAEPAGAGALLREAPVPEPHAYPWVCAGEHAAGSTESAPSSLFLSTRELPGLDLARSVQRIGHVALGRDDDGVVRRVPLLLRIGDACYPSFALQVVCESEGIAPRDVRTVPGAVELWRGGSRLQRIPVDGRGCMLINYRDRRREPRRPLALADVAAGSVSLDSADVRGRIVLVGSTAPALGDFHATPLEPHAADVQVLAEAVETILDGRFLAPAARRVQFLVSWAFLLAGAVFMVRLPPWRGVFVGVGLMALYVVFEKACFIWAGLWLDFIGPMAMMQASVILFPLWSYRSRSQGLLDEMAGLRSFDDLILSTMTSGLLVADESGRVVQSNARAARMLGCGADSLQGRGLKEIFESSPRALEAIDTAMRPLDPPARGPACSVPVRVPVALSCPTGDGDRLLDLSVSAVDSVDHARVRRSRRHYLLTFADVTEHVRILQEDERRARLAAIGEITAKLGHEIRNSLGGLRLYVENVREEIDPKSLGVRAIDSMVEEIESLYRKIDELREYARDPHLDLSNCDLKQVVEEALAFAGGKLREKRIQVFIESEPRLDPVVADRRQIRDAFQNLINNAVEAAPQGGSLRVGLEVSRGANGVPTGSHLVHFEDNGPGIPDEIGDQVFTLFFTTKPEAGTGLGLPIVKKIVENHGGRLTYVSRPGCTRFTVALPPARRGEGGA